MTALAALMGLGSMAATHGDRVGDADSLRALPLAARVYVVAVMAIGGGLLVLLAPGLQAPAPVMATLLALSVALSMLKVTLPLRRGDATMTLAQTPDIVCLLVAGADAAMVIAVASVVVQCLVRTRGSVSLHRTLFSMASLVITLQVLGLILAQFGGLDPALPLSSVAVPLLTLTTAYFVINTMMIALAVAMAKQASVTRVWHDNFLWSAPSYFLAAAIALPTAWAIRAEVYWPIPVAVVPLYFTYRAYRTYLRRVEDEQRHASELALLNESTTAALERAVQSESALAAERQRLTVERERLAVTLKSIGDGVIATDTFGRIVLMNAAAESMVGRTQAAVAGEMLNDVLAAGAIGSANQFALSIHEVLWDGIDSRLARSTPPAAGHQTRVIESCGTPIRDGSHSVIGGVWVLRDVTDTIRLEEERTKAAKLESLGILAGGLAHDFNNILTGVAGNISLAQMAPAADEEILGRLEEAERACLRAKGITSQLLTFSKGGAPVKTTASLATLIGDCTRFCLHGSNVAARVNVPADLWAADVDVNQISQVVQNLVLNAQQAMPTGGTLAVSVENVTVPTDGGAVNALPAGRYVRIAFVDQGIGIPPAHLSKIFDPYFTTKQKGSGLGLATCYSIIARHGGLITVDSIVGAGSTFAVYLPAADHLAAAPSPAPVPAPALRGGRVLVMDDEAMIRELAPELLAKLGYEAEVAAHGAEAVEMFAAARQADRPFDFVIVDLTVPGGMGGREAVPLLQEIDPAVKVVVSSGYADDAIIANYGDYGFCGVIPKPYVVADIRAALQQIGA